MSSASTPLPSTPVGLECPVCLYIPRKEIYQCLNGHSICHICTADIALCPTCRVAISGSNTVRVRNHYAETILDGMKFECNWKEQGCNALLPRAQLSEHEVVCKYGTMNLCKAFECSKNCRFQFSTMALDNPGKISEVLEHMETIHHFTIINKVGWAQSRGLTLHQDHFDFEIGTARPKRKNIVAFLEVVSGNHQDPSSDLFVLLINFEKDYQDQVLFSAAFAMLTSEREGTSSTIEIELSIKGQKNAEVAENWGDNCVSDIMWTMKPMGAPKLKEFLEIPLEDRPHFPFTIPVSHILKHYVNSAGILLCNIPFIKSSF